MLVYGVIKGEKKMTEELLKKLYQLKKENAYLTKNEIITRDYDYEMECLNNGTNETYEYIWKEIMEIFMRTKQDVKKEFKIYNLSEYPNVKYVGYYYDDKKYYDYVKLSKVYNKHICFIKLDWYDYFFSLEDLMKKLTEDGFNVSYRVATRFGILSLALSQNKIDEYLDEANHYMILKREN